jgi:hypothetical protein
MSINPFTFRNSSYGFVDMLILEDAEGLFELYQEQLSWAGH